jgi:hypothetical protein
MRLVLPRAAAMAAIVCLGLSACATRMEVRPLATGRSDVAAYELAGADLSALQREAQRLCPDGGEIHRQASQLQRPENVDGFWQGWLTQTSAWIDPPQRAAQLVVVCRAQPGRAVVQPASMPAAPASGAAGAVAALPTGPLTIEW